ncbi:MAG: hypothetical protein WCA35_02960, partial [Kovacikia sp.]
KAQFDLAVRYFTSIFTQNSQPVVLDLRDPYFLKNPSTASILNPPSNHGEMVDRGSRLNRGPFELGY